VDVGLDVAVDVAVGVDVAVDVAVGAAVGVAVGAAVGVPVGEAVGVGTPGPAWATADQTVTVSAPITSDPTTERRIVAFDMVLPLNACGLNGAKPPHVRAVGPGIQPIGPAFGEDVKLFLKLYLVTYMCFQRCFLDIYGNVAQQDTAAGRMKPRPNGIW
jgi:hypothetical protein